MNSKYLHGKINVPRSTLEFTVVAFLALCLAMIFTIKPVLITGIVIGMAVGLPLCLKKPEYSIFFLAVILPFRDIHLVSVLYVKRAAIWGLFTYVVIRQITLSRDMVAGNFRQIALFTKMTALFVLMIIVSVIRTASQLYTNFYMTNEMLKITIVDHALTVVEQMLIVYIVYYSINTLQHVRRLLDMMIAASGMVASLGILQYLYKGPPPFFSFLFSPKYQFYGRAASVFLTANNFGHFLAATLALACVLLFFGKISFKKRLCFLIPVITLNSIALLLSFSRGAMLSLFWGMITIGYLYYVKVCRKRITWKVVLMTGLICCLVLLAIYYYDVYLQYRFASYYKGYEAALFLLRNHADYGRGQVAIQSIKAFFQAPILGIGYDVFIGQRFFEGLGIDNQYLKVLAEMGILGFIPFSILLGAVVRSGLKVWRTPYKHYATDELQILMLSLLTGFSVIAFSYLFATNLYIRSISGYHWVFSGAIFVLERQYLDRPHAETLLHKDNK